jgi:hypothetical protein
VCALFLSLAPQSPAIKMKLVNQDVRSTFHAPVCHAGSTSASLTKGVQNSAAPVLPFMLSPASCLLQCLHAVKARYSPWNVNSIDRALLLSPKFESEHINVINAIQFTILFNLPCDSIYHAIQFTMRFNLPCDSIYLSHTVNRGLTVTR